MTSSIESPSGLLLVDKPSGMSSFDVIRRLRRQTDVRKIGHAGTLDPMATGLMLMLFGSATKRAQGLLGLDKTYWGELTLGATSTTGDREGELTRVSERIPTLAEVEAALAAFQGDIIQTTPQYSAVKIGGVRAYKLAQRGKTVTMPPRQVTIYRQQLLHYAYPVVEFEVTVSSGTYIRSLAQDIGAKLATGAHLSQLRRTRVGEYDIAQAHELAEIDAVTLQTLL